MRILHTADWHLGHRLYDNDRTPEHAAALTWLLELVDQEKIDVAIVAGDIFDISNPSNQARELYYGFLAKLLKTTVSATVVVGGNHDSPSMLDAPAELMRSLNLHVVGAARSQVQNEVVQIRIDRPTGAEELVVAAVPFLRERDVRTTAFGETPEERMTALRRGIQDHFTAVAAAAQATRSNEEVPIVATGHLFVGGAKDDQDKVSHIYLADENNIEVGNFPKCFDYVALGHVHRAQRVNDRGDIRYSGSLVPLTFVEGQRRRSVRIVEVGKAGQPVTSRKVYVPYGRALHRMRGTLEAVKAKIRTAVTEHLALEGTGYLTPWAEVVVQSDDRVANLPEELQACVEEVAGPSPVREPIRFVRRSQEPLNTAPASAPTERRNLEELKPVDVFNIVCAAEQLTEEASAKLRTDFQDLLNWHQDQDPAA